MSLFRERVSQSNFSLTGLGSFRAYPCVDERSLGSLLTRLRWSIDLSFFQNPVSGLGQVAGHLRRRGVVGKYFMNVLSHWVDMPSPVPW